MKKILSEYTIGNLLKMIRSNSGLSQKDFGKIIGKVHATVSDNENDRKRIYMKDFIDILKKFDYEVYIVNDDKRKIRIREYEPYEIMRILKELSGMNVPEFADIIGKKKTWLVDSQAGKINFYANDLFSLAHSLGFKLEIEKK